MIRTVRAALVGVVLSIGAQQASAAFHLIDINEVYSNADGTVQYVELVALSSSQTQLQLTRLVVRSADGSTVTIVLDLAEAFPSLGLGGTVLIATDGFEAAAGFAPDYVIPNHALIPFPSGRVTFEADPSQGGTIIDGVAYGSYSGSNSPYGSPAPALPCNGRSSLTRTVGGSNDNALAFMIRAASPKRNDGTTVQLQLPVGTDCNHNSSPDLCDIATGFSSDLNGNGIPDECDPVTGCNQDPDACVDDDVCNGVETCNIESGQCEPGTPPDCDDHDACTVDDCDPVAGCFSDPLNCDDADRCTIDHCDTLAGCRHETICPLGFACQGGECFCPDPRGDFDLDGDVDRVDAAHEFACLGGPGGELGADCACADMFGDGDVNLLDLAVFLNGFVLP